MAIGHQKTERRAIIESGHGFDFQVLQRNRLHRAKVTGRHGRAAACCNWAARETTYDDPQSSEWHFVTPDPATAKILS
jgi:hypothetical protein